MSEGCDECEMWRQKGAAFCPVCGSRLERPPERPLIDTFILLGTTAVAFIILFNTAYVIVNFAGICQSLEPWKFAASISFGLVDVRLGYYNGVWADLVLAVCVVVETACVVYALWRLWTILKERPEDYHAQATSGISSATAALAASLFFSIVGVILTSLQGQAPNTDWMDEFDNYTMVFMLTRAGVSEELLFRVLYIGIPMAIIALFYRRDTRSWQYLLGGFGMSKVAAVLIVVSSVLFGLAHYDGWGWSKVPLTMFGGLLFAYVYTEHGLYASIIMHTANDTILTLTYSGLSVLSMVAEFSLIGLGFLVILHWILHPNRELTDFKNMATFPEKLENNLIEQWKRH